MLRVARTNFHSIDVAFDAQINQKRSQVWVVDSVAVNLKRFAFFLGNANKQHYFGPMNAVKKKIIIKREISSDHRVEYK